MLEIDPKSIKEDDEPLFQRVADKISWAMGTWPNILFWIVVVVLWFAIFAFHIVSPNANFLPSWFVGTAFNFPLNLITTLAELYIGFLVGAASNRSERNLERALDRLSQQEQASIVMELHISELIKENTDLTKEIQIATAKIEEVHRHVSALTDHFNLDAGISDPEPTKEDK